MRNEKANRRALMTLATNAANAADKAQQSQVVKNAATRNQEFAAFIRRETEDAATIEDLIYLEMALQNQDFLTAQTNADRQSIKNAQTDYKKLEVVVHQMRTDPEAYFLANRSLKETGDDLRKQPKSRGPQQISGNKARLQNRASFFPIDQRAAWDARIKLASRTGTMLRALHKNVVANNERLLKDWEQEADRERDN